MGSDLSRKNVLNLAVLMFACRIGSLRGLDRVTDDALFRDNWCVFNRVRMDTVLRNALLPDQLFDPQQPRFQIRFTRAPT